MTGFISHAERLSMPRRTYPKTLVQDYEIISTEEEVFDGRVVRKPCVKTVHPQDRFRGVNAKDFALENVIAAGAVDMLRETHYSVNTLGELDDRMQAPMAELFGAIDAEQNNVTNTDEQ